MIGEIRWYWIIRCVAYLKIGIPRGSLGDLVAGSAPRALERCCELAKTVSGHHRNRLRIT